MKVNILQIKTDLSPLMVHLSYQEAASKMKGHQVYRRPIPC